MKLAVVSRHFSKVGGGAESYAVHLALAMRNECEITVVSHVMDAPGAGFEHLAVPPSPLRSGWISRLWFNWHVKQLTAGRFDIVHSHENLSHGDVHTVHVKTVHASLREKKMGLLRRLLSPRLQSYLWLERQRLRESRAQIVYVSQLLQQETHEAMDGLSPGTVIPPGVDWPELETSDAQRSAAREKLGLAQDNRMVIGFIGHDFKKKGLDALLRAVALLPFGVTLLVVGNPAQAAHYQPLVDALGPGKACHFLGVVRDMPTIYAALDCLAHPTTQDVFPMVLLEAMAHGVAVITTVAPYNSMASALTHEGDTLLLADPHDHVQLSRLLAAVAEDEALRSRLAQAGRAYSRKFSWTDVKEAYYEVYRQARAQRGVQ